MVLEWFLVVIVGGLKSVIVDQNPKSKNHLSTQKHPPRGPPEAKQGREHLNFKNNLT